MSSPEHPHWHLATRIAFRFCVLYFGLYVIATQMLESLLGLGDDFRWIERLNEWMVVWTGAHVFHTPVRHVLTGSGDRLFDWIQALGLLVVALTLTTVWSVVDRRRPDYGRLDRYFRVFLRFSLGATMLSYGIDKVFPLQMPAPSLSRLLEPFGNFSPMGVLWYSVGASFSYERVVGSAEVAGAVFLFFARTAGLGAFVCLVDTIEIFALNMTYDVPVKLFSFHLILMSAFLALPHAIRLSKVLLSSGARTWWAALAQSAVAAYLVIVAVHGGVLAWRASPSGGAPRPPLYGIWLVGNMTVNDATRPPVLTDPDRWRRVIIDRPNVVTIWFMDDSVSGYPAHVDTTTKVVTLSPRGMPAATFSFSQPSATRLEFDGSMSGRRIHASMSLLDRTQFLLVSRGFHWVQEAPFNR